MSTFDSQNRRELDQLVEESSLTHAVPRREFLRRATAAGLSIGAASSLLAACGGASTTGASTKVQTIDALTEWSGEELASFNAINAAFTQKTGIKVNVESTRDLPAVLTTRIRGNNPPDLCVLPTLSLMHQLATQGKLLRLDKFFNMSNYRQNYAQAWIDVSSYNGGLYAVLPKANTKGTIWYNPTAFEAVGATIPQTWDELIAVSNKLASSGKYPWSMGVESGAASGWAAADWLAEIYINKYGPEKYDQWVAHKISWTDASIKDAFQLFGQIVHGKHYINGGPQAVLATNFQDASFQLYTSPPKSYMYYLGDFTAGFITGQYKTIQAGKGFNFFPFPTIDPQYKGAITGGADLMTALRDNDGTRQFMEFMSTAEAQSIWVKRGGATSVNKAVDLSLYPNDVARASAQQLTQATSFRIGADDLMPAQLENAWWKGLLTFIGDPKQLDSVLSSLESTAQQSYQ